jgi:hypothetical protein
MANRLVIVGTCEPGEDTKALQALARFVSDTQPDEIVCTDQSIPLLERLREVYDGPIGVHAIAGDSSSDELLDPFGAKLLPEYYRVAPGWITTDKPDCCEASRIAGNTALNAARKFNKCVVLGHTGRMGIGSQTMGYGGEISKTVTGMEVGTLMDRKLARSVGGQQGFGLLTVEGQRVKPEVVPITRGMFTVDGEVWKL